MSATDPNHSFSQEVYTRDRKQFLSGLALIAADTFPALEAWRTPPNGTVDTLSRLATAATFLYGSARATIGGMNSLQQLSQRHNRAVTEHEIDTV